MSREWKPGDVAMIEVGCSANRHVGVFTGAGWRYGDEKWVANDAAIVTVFRPLVVIDPEDETALRAVAALLMRLDRGYDDDTWLDLRDALREFANPTPPKPDEPTGLGAVVEDERGAKWLRVGRDLPRAWASEGNVGGSMAGWCRYADIPAVRVLSEGVQP